MRGRIVPRHIQAKHLQVVEQARERQVRREGPFLINRCRSRIVALVDARHAIVHERPRQFRGTPDRGDGDRGDGDPRAGPSDL